MNTKDSNPKDLLGSARLPLHLWPETATALGCLAMLEGALKYGRSNFRVIGVRASIYIDAAKRHMNRWFEGEDIDPDSGLPHLGKALACLAILVDAQAAHKLTDDRNVTGGYEALLTELTPHVQRLKDRAADLPAPTHYLHVAPNSSIWRVENFCGDNHKSWRCTLPLGHTGEHVATSEWEKSERFIEGVRYHDWENKP